MLVQSAISLEYIRVPVRATAAGVYVNPTAYTVQMAFIVGSANPASGDWKAATWDSVPSTPTSGTYVAQCLVGPGGTVTLATGIYNVWIKITAMPEIPVEQVGTVTIN